MGRLPAGRGRLTAPLAFAYRRAVAPLMWVFVALASVELVVVHLLVAMWSMAAAATLSIVTGGLIVWLVFAIRAMRHRPVLVGADAVVMRVGAIRSITIPRASIARLRATVDRSELKRRGAINLALIAHPNVVLDLAPPLPGRRGPITLVAHRLDDAAGFAASLGPLPRGG